MDHLQSLSQVEFRWRSSWPVLVKFLGPPQPRSYPGLAVNKRFPWTYVPVYLAAQFGGALRICWSCSVVDPPMQNMWVNGHTAEKVQKNVVQMWCARPFDEPWDTKFSPSQRPDLPLLWSG